MLPFDIQIKGFIIGVLFAMFVIPWIQGLIARNTKPSVAVA